MTPISSKQYQVIMFAAGVTYSIFGLALSVHFNEPPLARLPITLMLIASAVFVYLFKIDRQGSEKLAYMCVVLTTLHFCFLIYSKYHPSYILGYYIVLTICASIIFSRRALITYFLICIPPTLYVLYFVDIDYDRSLLYLNSLTFTSFLFALQYMKIIVFEKLDRAYSDLRDSKRQIEQNYSSNLQVAHDLGSPVSALNAVAHVIKNENNKAYKILNSSIQRINEISEDLLIKHKSDKLNIESNFFDLENNISQIINEKRKEFRNLKELSINYQLKSPLLFDVHIPKSEFKRVLSNILNNAIEATKDKRTSFVDVIIEPRDNSIKIFIKDNGCGIKPEHQPHIFMESISYKDNGNGLGLSHAKETIENWGGSINLIASSKNGTCFCIEIPTQP